MHEHELGFITSLQLCSMADVDRWPKEKNLKQREYITLYGTKQFFKSRRPV